MLREWKFQKTNILYFNFTLNTFMKYEFTIDIVKFYVSNIRY